MRPLVKICGLTRPEDARLCRDAGADLLGVIFAESPRQVTVGQAADIRAACTHAPLVGVFTDDTPEHIADVVAAVGLDVVQLHACDDPERWAAVARATGVAVLPAVTSDRADEAAAAVIARADLPLTGLLLDLPKRSRDAGPDGRVALLEAAKRCRQDRNHRKQRNADPELVARFLAAVDHPEVDRVH